MAKKRRKCRTRMPGGAYAVDEQAQLLSARRYKSMATIYNRATMTDNNITTTSNVATGNLVEALSATKTAVADNYSPGDLVTYVLSITNTGNNAFSGISVTDDLGAYTFGNNSLVPLDYVSGSVRYYLNGVLQNAPGVQAGPPLVLNNITVPANGNVTLLYAARVNEFAPLGAEASIRNTARITGAGISLPVTATAVVDQQNGLQLTISKSICPSSVVEGDPVTYTITIQNNGTIPATATDNVIISDVFDPVLNITGVTFNGTPWFSPQNYTYNSATGLFTTVSGQITVPAASYTQNPATGVWTLTPGSSVLKITGTL